MTVCFVVQLKDLGVASESPPMSEINSSLPVGAQIEAAVLSRQKSQLEQSGEAALKLIEETSSTAPRPSLDPAKGNNVNKSV
ncbi:MAG: hypothetical protein AAF355_14870 [Myxococcota bacterium]